MFGYAVDKIRAMEESLMATQPEGALMQRAAAALAGVITAELVERRGRIYGARVLIMVGGGNNGGDALYAGSRLARRGAEVLVVPVIGTPHPQGLAALKAAGGRLVDLEQLEAASGDDHDAAELDLDIAVDGILGIGGRPGLPASSKVLLQRLSTALVPIIAVDLPSGVNCDTGAVPSDAVRATRTVTFGALKPCHLLEPAKSHCGVVELVQLGFDRGVHHPDLFAAVDEDFVALRWPFPDVSSDKYSRGVVGIDTGSEQYPGAGILSTYGAAYAGAGMVRFLGPENAARVIQAQLPHVVFAPGRVQANLFGSGWGEREGGRETLEQALKDGLPAVVDADGLRYLPPELPSSWLLTPHAGELARLLDCDRAAVQADPIAAVKAGADQTGATVLLKGATQLVAQPGSECVEVALPGPSWTAQAGSGDVLAGICATVLAAGRPAALAGVLGASLQALASASAPGTLPPHRVAQQAAAVLGRLRARRDEVLTP